MSSSNVLSVQLLRQEKVHPRCLRPLACQHRKARTEGRVVEETETLATRYIDVVLQAESRSERK